MSETTPFYTIDCRTPADIILKYTSEYAQKEFSFRLCEAVMNAAPEGLDDYSVFDADDKALNKVNKVIHASINADANKVIQCKYDEMSTYMADMANKGVLQRLPPNTIRRLKLYLKGFNEIYDRFCGRKCRWVITGVPAHDEDDQNDHTQINHLNVLFWLKSTVVYEDINELSKSLAKLSHTIHSLVTDSLLDSMLPAEPATEEPATEKTK